MAENKEKKYYSWCFTINNYTVEVVELVKEWGCEYLIFGKEVGKSGTPHLQGYVSFGSQKTLSTLKKKFHATAHWEVARGTPKQASDYCAKDGDVFEKGTRPLSNTDKGTGEKRRWEDAFVAVKEGRLEDVPKDILCTRLKNIQYAVSQVEMSQMKVETIQGDFPHQWWYGPPGTGKSRRAREDYPDAYIKDCTNKWWDGYTGQDVVIIEDFDKFQIKQTTYMKVWTDRYPFRAETKCGSILIRPGKIITTSNFHPDEIWDDSDVNAVAMKRRHQVVYFPVTLFSPPPPPGSGGPAAAPGWSARFVAPNIQTRPPDRSHSRVATPPFTDEEMDAQLNVNIGL